MCYGNGGERQQEISKQLLPRVRGRDSIRSTQSGSQNVKVKALVHGKLHVSSVWKV